MLNTDKINPIFKFSTNVKRSYIPKKNSLESINPKNYTWKQLFKIMNKIKYTWHMKKFDDNFTLDMQSLNKCIYTNLKYCEKIPNLILRNNILITDVNSFFQTNLFDYLTQEQEVFDYYDNLFKNKQYFPKNNDENEEIFFGNFVLKFKDILYSIQKNKKSMRQLKKLRWYLILDEDNFFEDESKKKNNIFNINNNDFLLDFCKEVDNMNDSFDESETKIMYDEYIKNDKDKIMDFLDEIYDEKVINDDLIDKLLKYESNPFFYIIKLIFISINIFCKATICHLLNSFANIKENKNEEGKLLINEYLLNFNNFVDSCLIINKKCENINIVMNFLYESLFQNYPNFPRFSIFRMCLRIWFTEANTHLIGKNTLLSKISKQLVSIFSTNLKEELFNKMEDNLKNKNFNIKSVNYDKSKSFGLRSSFMLFKSDNTSFKMNNGLSSYGTGFINAYDDSDKVYKIMEKGLSIINDTYSNEYSVYTLHLSSIDTNSFYIDLENNFNNIINYYITKLFDVYLTEKNHQIKEIIDSIFLYFDNYFFKSRILSNLKKNIYEKVYSELKNNLLEYTKNKYLDNICKIKKVNNLSHKSKSNSSSTKSNVSSNNLNSKSNLKSSSIFDLNNDFNFENINFNQNTENNYEKIKKEIINYIMKNTISDTNSKSTYNKIEKKLEDINEQINIYDLFISIEDWHDQHMNTIKRNDQRIMEELIKVNMQINMKINIPLTFDQFKRHLLSYSLQYDWPYIKKVKSVEKYISLHKDNIIDKDKDKDNDVEMEDNNINELGLNYFNNLDNIGNDNNNNNNHNEFGLNYFNNLNNFGNVYNNNNNNNEGGLNYFNNLNNIGNTNDIFSSGFNLTSSFFE